MKGNLKYHHNYVPFYANRKFLITDQVTNSDIYSPISHPISVFRM